MDLLFKLIIGFLFGMLGCCYANRQQGIPIQWRQNIIVSLISTLVINLIVTHL